jgi:hypothetical protein
MTIYKFVPDSRSHDVLLNVTAIKIYSLIFGIFQKNGIYTSITTFLQLFVHLHIILEIRVN